MFEVVNYVQDRLKLGVGGGGESTDKIGTTNMEFK